MPANHRSTSRSASAAIFLAFFVTAFFGRGDEALADFRVCNGTQNLVGVAIGYRASEGWISEGWWQVPATSCATLIEGRLQSRYYYLYAEDAARGGRWAGEIGMCVADNEFKIVGVNDCVARGYQRMPFEEYDTGRQGSWMVQLSDAPIGDGPLGDEPAGSPDGGPERTPDVTAPREPAEDGGDEEGNGADDAPDNGEDSSQ